MSRGRPLPLEGTLVVSLEQAVAAPLATRKLADAGARVLKVERPEGDFARGYDRMVEGESAYFVWLNRGKESVVLDLKDEEDRALLVRMVAAADVFVQNLAPGAAARAGFGSEELRERHSRLVTCDISGYGSSGPWARMKAYDNLVQGEAGLQAVTGTPEAPARVGISICDIAAGMHAYAAVLEALVLRARTGQGARLEVSLFDSLADWMSVPWLQWTYGGKAPPRSGLEHPSIAPYGPFVSREGDVVLLAVQNEREWRRLCERALGRAELVDDPRFRDNPARVANRRELEKEIGEVLGRLGTSDLTARLTEADIAHGRVNEVAAFARHPQLRLMDVTTASGDVRLPAEPVRWGGEEEGGAGRPGDGAGHLTGEASPDLPRVPGLDEHGEALRREFGRGGR